MNGIVKRTVKRTAKERSQSWPQFGVSSQEHILWVWSLCYKACHQNINTTSAIRGQLNTNWCGQPLLTQQSIYLTHHQLCSGCSHHYLQRKEAASNSTAPFYHGKVCLNDGSKNPHKSAGRVCATIHSCSLDTASAQRVLPRDQFFTIH